MNPKALSLLGLILLAATARAQQPQPSCRLSYDPVVDPDSGLPFYNECLARLQLPPSTPVVRRAALEASAAAGVGRLLQARSGAEGPSAQDYLKLLPAPASDGAAGEAVVVDLDIITRFAPEGFVYVGRPGFLPARDPRQSLSPKPQDRSEPAPASMDGSRVSLRIAYPEGDMYMKIWNADQLAALQAGHAAPDSASAALAAASAAFPQSANAAAAAAATTEAAAGRQHAGTGGAARRLLASNGNSNGNGNNGNGNSAAPARTEVTADALQYPFSTVSYINITRYNNVPDMACTGVMAGPTSRLILTAAHCVYEFDAASGTGKGYQQAFVVNPGQSRSLANNTISTPFGRASTNLAEVMAQWMLKGNFDFDIGLIRLNVHATLAGRAPGSLAFNYTCSQKSFALASAGYAADLGMPGAMWKQNLTTNADMCSGSVAQKMSFAYSAGQDGSPLWTPADNTVRFVMSRPGVAVPITPTYYSWILDFTSRNIINVVPLQLQGTTGSPALFFRCDPTTRACVGSRKANATSWYFHPISVAKKWAMRYPNMALCLTANNTAALAGNTTASVYLAPCNSDNRFVFPPNQLWNVDTFPEVAAIPAAKTDSGAYLSCAGEGAPLVARSAAACSGKDACYWKQVSV